MRFCPNMKVLKALPEFQRMKEYYAPRHYNDHHLAIALQLFRETHSDKYPFDWFPEDSAGKGVFTRFMNHELKRVKLSQTSASMQRDDISRLYSTLYSTYTPEVLADRIGMLNDEFRKELDKIVAADKTGRSRQELLKAQGDGKDNGYVVIMNTVFNKLKRLYGNVEDMMNRYKAKYPDATEEELAEARRKSEYLSQEYNTVLANKERLAALAASSIGEGEGFIVNVRDFEISFEDVKDLNSPMEDVRNEDGTDADESSKGERYADFRIVKMMETLGPRARRLISRIAKTDATGNVVKDDLGRTRYLDSRQAAIGLTTALINSNPATMMDDLRAASDNNPWMKGVINELEKNPDKQTTVYCNFKKAATLFIYTNIEGNSYTPHIANSRSQGHALMRDAGSNVSAGYVLDEDTSIYVGYGSLRDADKIREIHKKFTELKDRIINGTQNIRMVKGDKKPKNVTQEYEKLEPVDAMKEFFRLNPDVPKQVSDYLRGLGYSITPDEVETISLQQMDPKSFGYVAGWKDWKATKGRNKLYRLVAWMDAAYERAEEIWKGTGPKTGQYFYNTCADEYRHIDNCIALAKYNEVEPRTNMDGKSMSAYNNVNLLHQIFDLLTNADHLEEGPGPGSYQERLENEFLRYEGMSLGYGADRRAIGWLKWLASGKYRQTDIREAMRVTDMPTFNHVEYAKLTRPQKLTNSLVQFFKASRMFSQGTEPFCAVEFPIQSDYSTAYNFCYCPKLSIDTFTDETKPVEEWNEPVSLVDSDLVEAIADEVLAETERIAAIEERVKNDKDGKNRPVLSVYERQGMKFQIFPEFNDNGFRQAYKERTNPNDARQFVKEQVAAQLEKIRQKDIETVEKEGILTNRYLRDLGVYSKDGKVSSLKESSRKKLDEWFYNTFYARLQMVKLWDGGLQNFDGLIDFEKRNMLLHATRTSLYTNATWNGKPVGKESENVMYVGDEVSESAFLKSILGMLKDLLDKELITPVQYRGMKKAYSKIKSTDGQGFRTLESYRDVMIMSDQWDDRHESAYQRIIAGKPLKGDIDVFMQNIKPVATGFEHIDAAEGKLQKPVKLTFLHKYSEAVLLPVALSKYCLSAQSVPLRAFDAAQAELKKQGKPVDLFLFHSGAKVGAHSLVKPLMRWSDFKDDEERKAHGWKGQKLNEHILKDEKSITDYLVSSVKANKWSIHTIPYKYYGIAAATPPHGVDDKIARASQKEKTVWANIQPGDMIEVNGVPMLATEARDLYYKLKSANIVEAYKKIREVFTDTDQLERIFKEELANKSYQPQELKFALTHLADGTFALPMFSPNVAHQVQELLASIIKKRMTKIKTKGANILVTTAVGMEADVDPYMGGFPESYKLGVEFQGEGKNQRLKWFDAGLPLPEALREFANADGEITPEMLWGYEDKDGNHIKGLVENGIIPMEALLFDASRTPSDAEHSTVPCRVKWFSSRLEGSNMKVAKEAMVTTGQDFDGDKLRADFPEYDVVWDEDKLNEEYDRLLGLGTDAGAANLAIGNIKDKDVNAALNGFKKWREAVINGDIPGGSKFRKVRVVSYDSSKSPLENSARARHNMMIALTRGQLTSVEGSRRVLIPGGCEESKIYAKTLHLVRLAKDPTLKKKICDTMVLDTKYGGLGLENEKAAKAFGSVVGMYEVLTDLYDDDLTVLVRAVSNADTPYTLTHSLDAYDYLMGGAEMIGIYALYNSAQQMLQRLDMEYVPSENAEGYRTVINLFGKPIKELFSVENREGTFASLGLARLLNAAVDNGKDPILGYLNQTKEMAEMTSFLFAAGIDEEQVHLIMNQPVVIELINRLKGRDSEGLRKEAEKLVEELQSQFNDKRVSFSDAIEKAGAMKEEDYIGTLQMSLEEIKNSQDIPLINQQTGILYILSHLSSGAKTLADFIRLTRPESDSGSIGSSISDIILKHIALEDFREKLAKNPDSSIHISGMRDVLKKRDVHEGWDPKFIMEQLGDKLTEVVALNSLMMDSSLDMFKEYFPQARADWIGTARKIFKMYHVNSKDAKRSIIEHITQEMILWKLLDNEKFIQGDPQEEQKRIIVDVPHDLRMLKKRIENAKQNPGKDPAAEALIDNAFLDKFTTTSPEETKDRPRILFSLNGPAVEGMADSIRAYWGEMLQSSDESVRKLAVDLFKYNMYTSGFGYGMYEFAHFAPFSVLMETPGYIDALREVQRSTWTSDSVEEENFINQYILNHWGDSKFLLNVTDKTFPIGVDSITRELNPQLYDRIKDERYIILNAGDPDHRTQILYRLDKDRNGAIHPVVAEKLGVRLQGNQVTLQYNPRLNFWEVHPIVAGNDSAWGVRDDVEENHFAESNYEAGLENSTYTHGYVNSIGAVRNGEVDKTKIGTGFAASLGLIPTQQEANSMEELEQKAEAASQQNGQMDETPPPLTAEDEILANYTPMMGLGFAGVDMAALEKAKVGANPEAETTVKKGNYLSIARRQPDGKIKTERVPATPANIREARKQRVYSRLNARLREILREKGVAVGALNELEARMSLAGVTDFDTAMVTAEGLKEMIRIAEGYLGESALPEEFAHFGIEMIGHDNPLVKRLLDVLNNNDDALREAFEGQYDDYVKSYGNDREKLVTEAAGKLVAKQMFRQEEIRTSPVRRILQRVVDAIKSFLRRFRRDEIQNAIFEANDIASKIGRELLGGKILDDKTLQDINRNGQLYAKAEKVKKNLDGKEDVLHRILKNELKRLDILQRRIGYDKEKMRESKSIAAVELQIKKLENSIKNYKTEDAIITYMNDSLDFLTKTQEKLTSDIDSGKYKANEICRKLNMVRDTLYGFSAVLDDVSKAIAEGEVKDSVGLSQAINETAGVLRRFFEYYNMQAMHYFKEMLSNVYGEHGVTIDIGKEKGRVITIDEMAHRADRDISLASRWFHAIADCNDYALNAIDDLTRSAKYKARSRTLSIKPRIEKAVAELIKETGSNDQSWMFEWKRYDGGKWCDGRQDDGKLHKSGEYITEDKAKELGGAKYRFYQTMMEIKKDADGYLPDSLTGERKIVMLRKYTWDRVKESEGIKQKTMEVWEGVRNSILDTSSSIDYDNYEIRVDFEGNQVDMLPVNYLAKGKNESFDDMIDDVAASILAYAGMAYEYGELNNVIGILENAKFMSSQREVGQHAGKKTKRETIETENAIFHNPFTKKQAETNIAAALEDFFQMHIYGHIQANEGTIGNTKISKRKAVDTLNAITSYSQMAVNIPQRIANISVGLTQILFETVGAKTFSIADTKWALGLYMKESGDRLAETGKTDYDNKLSLWLDKFDVHQDNGRKYKNLSYKRSRLSKIFNSSLLYAGLTMGEDLLASTTALSVARNFKMRGPYGEDANLWDAYEVKYTDPARKTGAYLQLKDGYTKADGSALTQDDEIKFAKAVAGLNFELQGIYNLDDRSAVQQYALGALLIMYRKWIAPSLKRRYAGVHYNALKGRHEEGYHATMFRLLHDIVVSTKEQVSEEESAKSMLNIVDDLKALRTSISLNWNKMNDYEKSNVHRSMIELATVVGLYLACALLGKIPPPEYEGDDRGKVLKWWDQTVMSQMLRLRTEIGAMAPTPMLVDEAMHILKSPFAAIEPLTNTINAFQLLVPSNYMQTVKSGRYRGHKKAYKYFRELPIISMAKKVDNFLDPQPLINYYKNDAQY